MSEYYLKEAKLKTWFLFIFLDSGDCIMRKVKGFTLIELVVAMMIIAILTTFALPHFLEQMRKSKRTDAIVSLSELSQHQETFFSDNNQYTSLAGLRAEQKGFPIKGGTYYSKQPHTTGSQVNENYYTLTTGPSNVKKTFLLIANANGAQTDDEYCVRFTIDQAGNKRSYAKGQLKKSHEEMGEDSCW